MTRDAEDRAAALGAAMLVCGLVREPATDAVEACADLPLLTDDEWDAWRAGDDEDLRIAHACLVAEFERRGRQWEALEFLLHVRSAPAVDAPRTGSPSLLDRARRCLSRSGRASVDAATSDVVVVSRAQAVGVAAATLGWDLPQPDET